MRIYYRAHKRAFLFVILCVLLIAVSVACVVFARRLSLPALYVAAFAVFAYQSQIFIVYVASAYEYELDGTLFRIYRITGRRRLAVFDLDLIHARSLLGYKDYKKYVKENGRPARRYRCLCGVRKSLSHVLLYGDSALLFVPDEYFAAAVSSAVSGSDPVGDAGPVR